MIQYYHSYFRRKDMELGSALVCDSGGFLGAGNNPMVGMTVSVAVAVEEALKK